MSSASPPGPSAAISGSKKVVRTPKRASMRVGENTRRAVDRVAHQDMVAGLGEGEQRGADGRQAGRHQRRAAGMRLPFQAGQRVHQREGGFGAGSRVGRPVPFADGRRRAFRKCGLDGIEQHRRSPRHRHTDHVDLAADAAAGADDVRRRDRGGLLLRRRAGVRLGGGNFRIGSSDGGAKAGGSANAGKRPARHYPAQATGTRRRPPAETADLDPGSECTPSYKRRNYLLAHRKTSGSRRLAVSISPARVSGWTAANGCRGASLAMMPPSCIRILQANGPHWRFS